VRIDVKITRNVHIQLKDGKQKEFVQLFESQILPVLRQQRGFQDEITLVDNNNRALTISFWDDRKNAEQYHNSVFQSPPRVETYEVATTTLAMVA
jgi:heme-degrading monooxygenase HmoA